MSETEKQVIQELSVLNAGVINSLKTLETSHEKIAEQVETMFNWMFVDNGKKSIQSILTAQELS